MKSPDPFGCNASKLWKYIYIDLVPDGLAFWTYRNSLFESSPASLYHKLPLKTSAVLHPRQQFLQLIFLKSYLSRRLKQVVATRDSEHSPKTASFKTHLFKDSHRKYWLSDLQYLYAFSTYSCGCLRLTQLLLPDANNYLLISDERLIDPRVLTSHSLQLNKPHWKHIRVFSCI